MDLFEKKNFSMPMDGVEAEDNEGSQNQKGDARQKFDKEGLHPLIGRKGWNQAAEKSFRILHFFYPILESDSAIFTSSAPIWAQKVRFLLPFPSLQGERI
jgi:hypothetical protein